MDLIIDSGGRCRLVYDEAIDWGAVGTLTIQRASHVEPLAGGKPIAQLTKSEASRIIERLLKIKAGHLQPPSLWEVPIE